MLGERVAQLNAEYARAIDDDRLEQWPALFTDPCLYKITSADNYRRGLEAGLIYADSRGMLQDRVAALREANIYERQAYRHILGQSAGFFAHGATGRLLSRMNNDVGQVQQAVSETAGDLAR